MGRWMAEYTVKEKIFLYYTLFFILPPVALVFLFITHPHFFRTITPPSLLMLDLDHFKDYNDSYSHLEGDQCLKAVPISLRKEVPGPRNGSRSL